MDQFLVDIDALALIVAVLAAVASIGCGVEWLIRRFDPKVLPPPSRHTRRDWDQKAQIARYRGK